MLSWRQHPIKLQFHEPIPDISTILRERRMRFAGHCWGAKQELASNLLLWSPNHGKRRVGRPAITYIDLAAPVFNNFAPKLGCYYIQMRFPVFIGLF